MEEIPPHPVFGYAGLAKLLGVSADAVKLRAHRGKLGIEPVARIGRTLVFDAGELPQVEQPPREPPSPGKGRRRRER